MTHDIVERYLIDTLRPQLSAIETPLAIIECIIDSVRERMLSCISHWNDMAFRKAILIIGEEEGTFYSPKVELDFRCFVVVTLRNSALESIHADSYRPTGKSKRLSPGYIKAITSSSIEYFSKRDFSAIAEQIGPLENDIYGNLAKRYPISWMALTKLADSPARIIQYDPVLATTKPELNNLKPQQALDSHIFEQNRSLLTNVVADGYSLTIDPGFIRSLEITMEERTPYIADGFKTVSRNIEKLLTIMEYVLGNRLVFLTSNYFIANGYIERRAKLLQPGHDLEGMIKNWLNGNSLTDQHKGWLRRAAMGYTNRR